MRDSQYFYVRPEDVEEQTGRLILKNEEAHHCVTVLRKTVGDEFFVVDGLGREFDAAILAIDRNGVMCAIQETRIRPRELPFAVTLAQALIKKDRMDWLVQKATELGVSAVIPMATHRSVADPSRSKRDRWEKIALEAMKQSRRSVLPRILDVQPLDLVVAGADAPLRIMFHETASLSWTEFAARRGSGAADALLLIGPEGGFTSEELLGTEQHGFVALTLGARRLRAETAALCALSLFSTAHCL